MNISDEQGHIIYAYETTRDCSSRAAGISHASAPRSRPFACRRSGIAGAEPPRRAAKAGSAPGARALFLSALGLALLAFTAPASAHIALLDRGGLRADLGLYAATWLAATRDADFGAGIRSPGGTRKRNIAWGEAFARAKLDAAFRSQRAGRFYTELSVLGSLTRGFGDPSSKSFAQPEKITLEHLHVGWSSADLVLGLGKDSIDISVGAQDFEIGDGFLVSDGQMDEGDAAAVYLGPRNTFENSAILRLNTRPVRADVFWLDTRADSGGARPLGLNLEYVDPERGVLGAYAFRITAAPVSGFESRDGLEVLSLRGQGHPFLSSRLAKPLFLSFEVARERNPRPGRRVDAWGWYVEAGYRLASLPWAPRLGYRFSYFTGDDPATPESEAFDPLFVGAPRGIGTWFQGEITGQYLITNTNLAVHMLALDAHPREWLRLGLQYFHFRYAEPASAGATSHHFGDELDLFAEIVLGAHITAMPELAILVPGAGARQSFGANRPYLLAGFQLRFAL